jgi:hypothetical protein
VAEWVGYVEGMERIYDRYRNVDGGPGSVSKVNVGS